MTVKKIKYSQKEARRELRRLAGQLAALKKDFLAVALYLRQAPGYGEGMPEWGWSGVVLGIQDWWPKDVRELRQAARRGRA